jgi:ketosteroid isomerase-like protein
VAAALLAMLAGALLAASPAEPLLAADRALDDAVGRRDRESFLALVDADAVFAGATLLVGRDAIWSRWSRFFDPAGPTLRWRPTAGGIAPSGDLGWTTGEARYEWKAKGVSEPDLRYLTVWRRSADGRWVAVMDGSLEPVTPGPFSRKAALTVTSRDGAMEAAIGTFERGEGAARSTGIFLVVREQKDGAWRVVRESEMPSPPGS